MVFNERAKKNIFDLKGLVVLFLCPLLSSCSSNQNNIAEIITPPIYPEEFASIPEDNENPQLIKLLSTEQKIKNISYGRNDPFLPPSLQGSQLSIPETFKYHGYISSSERPNAFVSFKNKTGIVKEGDVGGESTNLLPPGWFVANIDLDNQALTLTFQNSSVLIDLFPSQKP